MALEGRLPTDINSTAEAAEWLAANPPPPGYGSVGSQNDALWTSRLLSGDQTWRALEPGAPHKILSFDHNLRGNLTPWVGDRHEGAALGVPAKWSERQKDWVKGQLTPNEYVAAERLAGRLADQVGITPSQFQSARWMGGRHRTGVRSADPTFPHAVEAVSAAQGKRLNETPEWVLKEFIRNGGLLAVPGAMAIQEE